MRTLPNLLGRALDVEVPATAACGCIMCTSAVEFDAMRRGTTMQSDISGIDELISLHFHGKAWVCYDDARDNAIRRHIFP